MGNMIYTWTIKAVKTQHKFNVIFMAIRTKEQLKQLFQERKEIKQRQLQREKEKYKKASQQVKKLLMEKYRTKVEKPQSEQKKTTYINYSLSIYKSSTIERVSADEDLYQTREELMDDESGSINWDKWDELVNKLRKEFKQHGKRLPHTRKQEKD